MKISNLNRSLKIAEDFKIFHEEASSEISEGGGAKPLGRCEQVITFYFLLFTTIFMRSLLELLFSGNVSGKCS